MRTQDDAAALHVETTAPSWTEAVFHVLAHVRADGLPASLYSTWYVDLTAQALGPASARPLGQDAAALSALLHDHQTLASVQGLAWLWSDSAAALACVETDLTALREPQVRDMSLLQVLLHHAEAVELLRCAALLEAELCLGLPNVELDRPPLLDMLTQLLHHAPGLRGSTVTLLRPLTLHGRVWGSRIYLGVPGLGVTLEHVALQAAHEATVREVLAQRPPLSERQVEQTALVLLHARVAGSLWACAHRDWCEQLSVRDEQLQSAGLSARQRVVLDACLRSNR